MNFIKSLFLSAILLFALNASAQDTDQVKKRGPADSYSRSSISYLLLDFQGEKYSGELKQGIYGSVVPSKFDNNDLKEKILKAPYYHMPNPNLSRNREAVRRALAADKYANKIVKYWWRVNNDGSYSTALIQKRGFYNATDVDVAKADAEKRGRNALADAGEKLIANSYVMVLDFHDIKSMDDVYDAEDAAARKLAKKLGTEFKAVERKKNGYIGKLTAFLYKVNYPDTVQGYFMDAFIDENTIDIAKTDKIFSEVYSPFKYITTQSTDANGTQANPGQFLAPVVQKSKSQLMIQLVNNGISKVIDKLERNIEAFRVKTPLVSVHPLEAKIGKKEGLTHERRYFVWQYVENNAGKTTAKRKGVIRAKKVSDNRNNELGNTKSSVFYQVAGHKLEEGMTLQERKDYGIGISAGYSFAGGGLIRGEINAGQWANIPIRQFKLYAEGIFASQNLSATVIEGSMPSLGDYSFGILSLGILKEYPFARNFRFGWFVGWTGETITWPDAAEGEQISAGGMNWGANLATNLFSPSMQFIMTFNNHNYGSVSYTADTDTDPVDYDTKVADIFPDRSSFSVDLSIRLTF